jgi:polyphosphate glucokinase
MHILTIDVGGSHLKVLASGQSVPRKTDSGPSMTAAEMVDSVKSLTGDWKYDVVSLGFPGPVIHNAPIKEPANLGKGWVGFDYGAAFGRPTKIINDAAMQALGSYTGGRMLFLGLGTGMGSAMVVEGVLAPLELGHMPYRGKRVYEDFVGESALKRLGTKKWRREVTDVLEALSAALQPDYVVVGGGNADLLKELPPNARRGDNACAFIGGFRLWEPSAASHAMQFPDRASGLAAAAHAALTLSSAAWAGY